MKIGLVPISAKPYHAGHHYLIETAAAENDEVIVFASTSDRKRTGEFPIEGSVMVEVWNELIVPNLPENVSVRLGGSPVREVYEMIASSCDAIPTQDFTASDESEVPHTFTVYSDVVDTKSNYPVESRKKYMNPLYERGGVLFAAESNPSSYIRGSQAPAVRGEDLRRCLEQRDYLAFSKLVPSCISHVKYWDKLTRVV